MPGVAATPLRLTPELLRGFLGWLVDEGLSQESKQYREYTNKAREVVGVVLDCQTVAELAKRSKRWHEFVSRLLTYVGHKRGLGLKRVAADLRDCMPRKAAGGEDTYVPPLERVVKAGRKLSGDPEAYAAWLLLVSTGARFTTVVDVLLSFERERLVCLDTGVCRYHVDYKRGEKEQWAMYAPEEVWRWLAERLPMNVPEGEDRDRLYEDLRVRVVANGGVRVKHYRNFVFNKMIELGIPEGVADWVIGHKPDTVGRKNYLAKLAQADKWYPLYAQWLRREILSKL
ncbi:hypothetical protein Pyrde_2039 [Pyrodictium delaneyi]|uniref:Integrase SSV1 C-terminal domain-containing protein n=2 Tax=Pyrodictium delaneyi TaxID=1273541 RepID=A0A0P0N693_9CREN|nr:hypothetical protein Pyrde_2039 [Pyrodictium delaneyi]